MSTTMAQTTTDAAASTDDGDVSIVTTTEQVITTINVSEAPLLSTNIIITIAVWSAIFLFIVIFLSAYIACVKRRQTAKKDRRTKATMNGKVPRHHRPKGTRHPPPVPSKPRMSNRRDTRHNASRNARQPTSSQGVDNPIMMNSTNVDGPHAQPWYQNHAAFTQLPELHQANPTGSSQQGYPASGHYNQGNPGQIHHGNPTTQIHQEYPPTQYHQGNTMAPNPQENQPSQFHSQQGNPPGHTQHGYPDRHHHAIEPSTGHYQHDYIPGSNQPDYPPLARPTEYPDEDYQQGFTPIEHTI